MRAITTLCSANQATARELKLSRPAILALRSAFSKYEMAALRAAQRSISRNVILQRRRRETPSSVNRPPATRTQEPGSGTEASNN